MDHLDETTIALFIEKRLPGDRIQTLQHHIDACAECRQVVAALGRASVPLAVGSSLEPRPDAGLERGARIGRYVVLDRIGAGAMGAVYAAFDPDLDRKVAVKLLHGTAAADNTRLLREAQALARVSHPGVVAVHDVGTHGDQVFIAMELVAGGSFRSWLQTSRTWRAILHAAVQTARGLAAAHAAGLVHRDVKPDNILVDAHGRARIGDFGLAAGVGEPKRDPIVGEATSAFAAELTGSHMLVGTPAYMAPEQLAGEPATMRSDQFGFCATFYEAWFGVRPYPGTTVAEIVDTMKAGRLAEPRRDPGVPKRIRAAIVRGLAIEPAARFQTMDELALAITYEPWSRRRVAVAAAAGVALVGGVAVAIASTARHAPAPCGGAADEVARVATAERRARVHDAIVASGLPFAADTAKRVDDALGAYARGWVTQHTQACEATAVHHTQSPALLDRRMACLARRLIDLDAALDTLASSDRDRVRHALDVATDLPPISVCADPERFAGVPPPASPAAATEIAAVSRDIARASTLLQAGAPDQAAEIAGKAVADAERLQYPPLLAEAYDVRGQAQLSLGDPKPTRDSFEHAVVAATRAGAEDLEARALANLALLLRDTSPDGTIAVELARQALAVVQRSRRDPLLEAKIEYANVRVLAGLDSGAVVDHYKQGRARLQAAASSGADTRALQLDYDVIEAKLEINPSNGLVKYAVALAGAERLYGPDHPQVAAILVEMANLAVIAERPDEARGYAKRIAQILAPYPGDRLELRRIDAALERDPKKKAPILEEIVRESAAMHAPKSHQLAMDENDLAEALLAVERYREGLEHINAAIATWEALYGGHYEMMISSLVTKAQLLAGLEDWEGVSAAAERANAIVDRGGMRELVKVMARLILVESYFHQKRWSATLALIEESAPTIKLALLGDPVTKILDFYAAACRWELGQDRPAQLKAAREAFEIVKTSDASDEGSLAPLRAWLANKR